MIFARTISGFDPSPSGGVGCGGRSKYVLRILPLVGLCLPSLARKFWLRQTPVSTSLSSRSALKKLCFLSATPTGNLPWLGLLLFCVPVHAQDAVADLFSALADEIPASEIRFLPNLNDREEAAGNPEPPRLGGFADLPPDEYPGSAEIEAWEAAFSAGEIGGLVLHSDSRLYPPPEPDPETGIEVIVLDHRSLRHRLHEWITELDRSRLFVTFAREDRELAARAGRMAQSVGFDYAIMIQEEDSTAPPIHAGAFYATAQHRLAIDSRSARRLRTDITEMELLGERARRDSVSVFRDPVNRDERGLSRNEPEIFRKITLGDQFTQPTIEEIIVPGGIALGESAELDFTPVELLFSGANSRLYPIDPDTGEIDRNFGSFRLRGLDPDTGEVMMRQLPEDDPKLLKSLFDLARRSSRTRSDAVVDLDIDRRVSISSALRDTDAGYAFLFADTLPFEHLDYLPVTKSVIIDIGVFWNRSGIESSSSQEFETAFEVRFLSADSMRIAQTQLALEYEYDSADGTVRHGGNRGRYGSRLRDSTDVDGLGMGLAELARYAGWVALFRRLEEDAVPFLQGRYGFMKIDKTGRETPGRFR